ncbi:MAG TPA: LptE family protein [Mucilaginibacter sp.]|nr:LptE family protein [Mucilaginibacter sp.]
MRRLAATFFTVGILVLFSSSCSITLSGSSIPLEMKTINVGYFENNSPLVVGYLSQQFTEGLKDRIRSTTSLSIVEGDADGSMTGNITNYTIEPVSVQATNPNTPPLAGAERLTITVNVTYKYKADKKVDFNQSFSEYADFSGDISTQEQQLITAINKKLIDDIFNRAFANW